MRIMASERRSSTSVHESAPPENCRFLPLLRVTVKVDGRQTGFGAADDAARLVGAEKAGQIVQLKFTATSFVRGAPLLPSPC